MQPERRTAFLDESGNTGGNYLDPIQPVHVLAGWVVRDSVQNDFAGAVARAKKAMGMPELKGGQMLKTKRGRGEVAKLIEAARHFAAPVYSIWEKRFCAALRIVETFLDPMHNPRASWLPAGANLERNEIADRLLDILPPGYFENFIEAYRNPTSSGLGESAKSIGIALKLANEGRLAWTFDACANDVLDAIVSAERSGEHLGEHFPNGLPLNVTTSLNYPAFASIIRAVDFMFEASGSNGVIVHDETSEFASSFRDTFMFFKRIGPDHIGELEDGRSIRLGIGFVDELRLRKSHEEPLLQAADVLAAVIKAQCPGVRASHDDTLDALGELLLPGLFQQQLDCSWCTCVASEDFKAKLMRPLVQKIRRSGGRP